MKTEEMDSHFRCQVQDPAQPPAAVVSPCSALGGGIPSAGRIFRVFHW